MTNLHSQKLIKLKAGERADIYKGTKLSIYADNKEEIFEAELLSQSPDGSLTVVDKSINSSPIQVDLSSVAAVQTLVKNGDEVYRTGTFYDCLSINQHDFSRNTSFTFMPNGMTTKSLLLHAKKMSKETGIKRAEFLNQYCKEHFNSNHNKLMPKIKQYSPFTYNGVLYVPVELTADMTGGAGGFPYFIIIDSYAIKWGLDGQFSTPEQVHFKGDSLQLSDIEKLHNGWRIRPYVFGSEIKDFWYDIVKVDGSIVVSANVDKGDGVESGSITIGSERHRETEYFKRYSKLNLSAREIIVACDVDPEEEDAGFHYVSLNGVSIYLQSQDSEEYRLKYPDAAIHEPCFQFYSDSQAIELERFTQNCTDIWLLSFHAAYFANYADESREYNLINL